MHVSMYTHNTSITGPGCFSHIPRKPTHGMRHAYVRRARVCEGYVMSMRGVRGVYAGQKQEKTWKNMNKQEKT